MNYSLLRRLSAGEVCAALLATMTACGGGSSAPAADSADSSADGGTVKVGLLHSLTGSMAISEMSVRDAEVLAIDEINKAGGVNGCQIAYVEEDGASQPSTFAAKAEKLIDSDGVATIFGCWISSSRKAVKPIVEDYDALLWYPVTSFESFHAMSIRGVTRLTRIIGLVLSVSAVVLMVLTLR